MRIFHAMCRNLNNRIGEIIMEISTIKEKDKEIAIIKDNEILITDVQSALDSVFVK